MATSAQLISQLIGEVQELQKRVTDQYDSIDGLVAQKISEMNSAILGMQQTIGGLQANLLSHIGVGPNYLIDTAKFDLVCNSQKSQTYDYAITAERPSFTKIMQVQAGSNIDWARSSVKATVIDGISRPNLPEPMFGLTVNGALEKYVDIANFNYTKGIVVLDINLYTLTAAGASFSFLNPGCGSEAPVFSSKTGMANRVNGDFYSSAFYNILDFTPPSFTDGSSAFFEIVGNSLARLRPLEVTTASVSNMTYTDTDTLQRVTTSDILSRTMSWQHLHNNLGNNAPNGCVYMNRTYLIGAHWVNNPFSLKIAVTLPYLGSGNQGGRPVWVSEAAKIQRADFATNGGNRFPFGIRYTDY